MNPILTKSSSKLSKRWLS